jgi:hypothetical protein
MLENRWGESATTLPTGDLSRVFFIHCIRDRQSEAKETGRYYLTQEWKAREQRKNNVIWGWNSDLHGQSTNEKNLIRGWMNAASTSRRWFVNNGSGTFSWDWNQLNVSVRTRIWGILHRWRSNLSDKIANKEKFRWHGEAIWGILSNPKLIPYKNTHTTDFFEITNYLSLGLGSYLNSGILRCLPKKIALHTQATLSTHVHVSCQHCPMGKQNQTDSTS